jgi:hypothetical protein
MDLPFLLGTGLTTNRRSAKALGYIAHFAFGFLFALGYFGLFSALGRSSWLLGALFGLAHGMFAGTALVNVLLPVVHPHMGSTFSAANDRPLLEPPGFLMLNYGTSTPIVTVAAHIVYGAIVGAFVAASA